MAVLRYKGASHFRYRVVLATLSGRAIRIDEIRANEEQVGLRDYEACFLRLIEKVVNGCEVVINETGTAVRYRPGIIVGGSGLVHECGTSRAISYFLEPLLTLALFAKQPLGITMRGITNMANDIGADTLRVVSAPMLHYFGVTEDVKLQITKRGAPPLGGGEVVLQLPIVRELVPIHLTEASKIKRVRGVAYGAKVSPQIANRLVESARGVLNSYIPDVWIYTDVHKGQSSGSSAGFGLTLVAESIDGILLSAEVVSNAGELPEDVGTAAASALLEQISQGGVVDSAHQTFVLLLMCLGPEDVSRVRLGPLTPFTVEALRLMRSFLGTTFQVETTPEDDSLILSCRGAGFKNLSKKSTT